MTCQLPTFFYGLLEAPFVCRQDPCSRIIEEQNTAGYSRYQAEGRAARYSGYAEVIEKKPG